MVELTPEEIVVEKIPSSVVDESNSYIREAREIILSPILEERFFADERILGVYYLSEKKTLLDYLGEYESFLPKKYKEAFELRKKMLSLSENDVRNTIKDLVVKINGIQDIPQNLSEKERTAILNVLHSPEKYLNELNILFKLSLELGTDVVERMGIKARISLPNATSVVRKETTLKNYELAALVFFTNLKWYNDPNVVPFFLELTKGYVHPENYIQEFTTEKGEVFWKKIEKIFEDKDNIELFKLTVASAAVGVEKLTPFEFYLAVRTSELHRFELPFLGTIELKNLTRKLRKTNKHKEYDALIELAKKKIKTDSRKSPQV